MVLSLDQSCTQVQRLSVAGLSCHGFADALPPDPQAKGPLWGRSSTVALRPTLIQPERNTGLKACALGQFRQPRVQHSAKLADHSHGTVIGQQPTTRARPSFVHPPDTHQMGDCSPLGSGSIRITPVTVYLQSKGVAQT